ncbi:MAG: succinyl-diaminopimelate desuccinylase [Gammaproteobacteria bacterium]|nr:succinyl-diaminopimelate desuccinylase [Gammaproteobacteria bacterium]
MSATLQLTKELIAGESVTPADGGCQEIMINRLQALGFHIQRLPFADVSNFWAHYGSWEPLLVFAGHTDVVPSGPEHAWESPPFVPTERDGLLFGRGAADMKGSLAAMVVACEEYLGNNKPTGGIGFLITSDEEGPATDGTVRVMDWLSDKGIGIKYCVVGEPSSNKAVGDTIKIGRRGSLNASLTIQGIQGHVAYPHLADNPIHRALMPLSQLSEEIWDKGNESFPPTSFQISNIHSGTGVSNVIPDAVQVEFNFRFSTEVDEHILKQRCDAILKKCGINYTLNWSLSGNPFLTTGDELISATRQSIKDITGLETELSTSGGTSDGRFIAPSGAQVVELGPCNQSIHKINEHVRITDLDKLTELYRAILQNLL